MNNSLSIIIPSYEKHFNSFTNLLTSIINYCKDLHNLELIVVIENKNKETFCNILQEFKDLNYRIIYTEDILKKFGSDENPGEFLNRIGKFTFQSMKKLGGLSFASFNWSLVLDSESEFFKPFYINDLVSNYLENKYIFYTDIKVKGAKWKNSLGDIVHHNCAKSLDSKTTHLSMMEYYSWFYEKEKINLLLENLNSYFWECFTNKRIYHRHFFENVLYYIYVYDHHLSELSFINFLDTIDNFFPADLNLRIKEMISTKFLFVGIFEYLMSALTEDNISYLMPIFNQYKLPFMRFEPSIYSANYIKEMIKLPYFCAFISSHRLCWSRKKIAVCISGEFRNPLQNIGELKKFLTGVDCDLFIHTWISGNEPIIIKELNPRAYQFDKKINFSAMSKEIKYQEENTKEERDAGSISMFYSIQKSFELLHPFIDEYDFVLRLRPDIYFESSLQNILFEFSENGDILENTIYFPLSMHSQGINDQIAFGHITTISHYFKIFSYIQENISNMYFCPEFILLKHIIDANIKIALMNIPYALTRDLPHNHLNIFHQFQRENNLWWARSLNLPIYRDVTDFFYDKMQTMSDIGMNKIPSSFVIKLPYNQKEEQLHDKILSCKIHKPIPYVEARLIYKIHNKLINWSFNILEGQITESNNQNYNYFFVYYKKDELILSQWKYKNSILENHKISLARDLLFESDNYIDIICNNLLIKSANFTKYLKRFTFICFKKIFIFFLRLTIKIIPRPILLKIRSLLIKLINFR